MLMIKIATLAFVGLFLTLLFKNSKSEISVFISLAVSVLILLLIISQVQEIITFLRSVADKANIDTVYIGIVLKILAIAYLASFTSEICKDAGASSIATKVEFSGKIMILVLAIPILMAVLNSILQIM
ncbi:stage III sporulation protein AD [Clostridium weizhouense]|uniref:Stage III sporulation protein AD n=1 Tax=Clostridium weizhouense TaxID=2859781 RepID=A0ABS7ATE4_9CLOT|nr:stage III sporulation protein AD [Clostridium weizhouense]MBW6410941.1 stage III sporulation protein AD [Clostridium weizhouense]